MTRKFKEGDEVIVYKVKHDSGSSYNEGYYGCYFKGDIGILKSKPTSEIVRVYFPELRLNLAVHPKELKLRFYNRKRLTSKRLPI